jgi:hypothetical protein
MPTDSFPALYVARPPCVASALLCCVLNCDSCFRKARAHKFARFEREGATVPPKTPKIPSTAYKAPAFPGFLRAISLSLTLRQLLRQQVQGELSSILESTVTSRLLLPTERAQGHLPRIEDPSRLSLSHSHSHSATLFSFFPLPSPRLPTSPFRGGPLLSISWLSLGFVFRPICMCALNGPTVHY